MSKFQNVVPFGQRHRASLSEKIRLHQPHNRSREAVTRSRMTVRGRFPSFKMGRMIDWESQLERRACFRFEFSPAVINFEEQPSPIRFLSGDRLAKYTPDFQLSLVNGEIWFVEIKPYDHLLKPDIADTLSKASEHYHQEGFSFIVISDRELIEPILESNLAFLRHFQAHEIKASVEAQAIHWVEHTEQPTLSALNAYFRDKVTAYALLCRNIIQMDLSEPLTPHTKLFRPEENDHAKLLFSYRTAPDFEHVAICD